MFTRGSRRTPSPHSFIVIIPVCLFDRQQGTEKALRIEQLQRAACFL
ncbi:hypothetical protein HA075_24605 [bacterium BFN5]|nr:hypothetical protein HA075_24605 [bacterium BFN5]